MNDELRATPEATDEENPDWNRTIPDEEAQQTAQEADPDDLGGTSPTDIGLTAGGEGTEIGPDSEDRGGTPYGEGYVTGGVRHPTIADLPRESSDDA